MATAPELTRILKEDVGGKNTYDHLVEVLMKILIERPKNTFDSFELLSAYVKANPLNPDPEKGKPLPPSAAEVSLSTSTSIALICLRYDLNSHADIFLWQFH